MNKCTSIVFILLLLSLSAFPQDGNEFDFWVGQWDLTWENADGTKGKGINNIVKILDGKVIQENFQATDAGTLTGFKGTSLSVFNPNTKSWHQAWADNQGGYFNFVGEVEADRKIFKTKPITLNGKDIVLRMVFYNITEDALTWDWERSEDGGNTWTLSWRINYMRGS